MKEQAADAYKNLPGITVYWNWLGKKINIRTLLFEVGLLLIGISKLWRFDSGGDTIFLVTGLALLLLKIVTERTYKGYQAACLMGTFFLVMLIFLKTGEMNPFTLFIILFSMKGIEAERALKVLLVLNMVFFVGTIALCQMGFIYDDIYYFSRPGQMLARHSYGLGHPNQVFMRLLVICTIMLACIRGRYHGVKIALTVIVSIILYKGTDSRSGFLCTLLLLAVVVLLDKSTGKIRQLISVGMMAAYSIVVVLPVVFLFWDSSLVQAIDKVITGRISLGRNFLNSYSLSVVGVGRNISNGFVIDSSYMYIVIHYGILFYILYGMAMGCLLYTMYRKKMAYEIAAVVVLHIYAFVECVLINPMFNFCIIFAGSILMNYIPKKKRWRT